jgi:hypothetical protein
MGQECRRLEKAGRRASNQRMTHDTDDPGEESARQVGDFRP